MWRDESASDSVPHQGIPAEILAGKLVALALAIQFLSSQYSLKLKTSAVGPAIARDCAPLADDLSKRGVAQNLKILHGKLVEFPRAAIMKPLASAIETHRPESMLR